jgi:alpha-beta hydrolase superfamily lysophospholipase
VTIRRQALYFESGAERLFGWLHLPEQSGAQMGIVMCKPFGYEAVCMHRSWREFADEFAALGFPVIRFDYAGTGDSSGEDPGADRMDQWTDDVLAALATLRRQTGVREICLFGMRLGVLLAARAARRSDAVHGLIAVAPVVDGRRYSRELRALNTRTNSIDLEVAGFPLSAATVQGLAQIDLAAAKPGAVGEYLILDRNDLPGARAWADGLAAQGAAVRYLETPGFLEMTYTPHVSQIPAVMRDEILSWLRARPGRTSEAPGPGPAAPPALQTVLELIDAAGNRLQERAGYFDEASTLFGIVTVQPAAPNTSAMAPATGPRRGVILLNVGATSHIGPNRMYVTLARRWAAEGFVVLRLDIAGIGDSSTRPNRPDNEVYPPTAVDDVATAVDWLRRTYGVEDLTLLGLCAGAYHALRSSLRLPVTRALMINPLTFYWKEGMTLSDLQIAEVVRNPGVYRERIWSPAAWRKVLRGRVNLWRVGMVFVRRAGLGAEMSLRGFARRIGIRLPNDLGTDLRELATRGVRMVFIFARGDTGAELLRIQGGATVDELGAACQVHMIEGADHIFSQHGPRGELEQLLRREMSH